MRLNASLKILVSSSSSIIIFDQIVFVIDISFSLFQKFLKKDASSRSTSLENDSYDFVLFVDNNDNNNNKGTSIILFQNTRTNRNDDIVVGESK